MAREKRTVPWIGKRGGKFYAFWYDPGTRQTQKRSLRTSDPHEARDGFARFLAEGVDTVPGGDAGLTTEQALNQYLREHVNHVDEKGRRKVADTLRQEIAVRHLTAFFSTTPISDIDIPMSRRYADARRSGLIGGGSRRQDGKRADGSKIDRSHLRRASDSTIRRELNVLTAASNHAKEWKRIQALPSIELPAERRLGPDDEAPFFTQSELDTLLGMADGELRTFIVMAYWTGARRRSIQEIERYQVKWDQRRIHLQKTGKKATKKRQPIVPIFKPMEGAVGHLLATGGEKRLFATGDFYRPFHELCMDLGMGEERSHPHVLRHTRATLALQAGKPLYAVARLLGDTVATVERVYGHHSTDFLSEKMEELG